MKKFLIDCSIATLFVFAVLLGIREISQLNIFNAFDPLGQSLGDMELTDITFSRLRDDPQIDTNIVVVNIGNLPRAAIAQQIRIISHFKPKVIGIDSFFDCKDCPDGKVDSLCCPLAYDTLSNLIFGDAIREAGNVVMVTKLLQTRALLKSMGDIDIYDSLEHSDEILRPGAFEGYASLETDAEHQEDLKSCRRFNPQMMVNGKMEYAFAVKMAMLYDSVKTKRFLDRGNFSEVINYRGNIYDPFGASEFPGRYYTLDWDQALDSSSFVSSLFKDKIVIMGFLGDNLKDTSWDDKFFTPLNKVYAGKTRPDMYGVVVHANIVSMILNEDYIDELSLWQQIAIAVIVCFLNVMLFAFINQKLPHWFDLFSIVLQLTQILICTVLMMYIFNWFAFKLNLTYTLAALALVGTCFELYVNVVKRVLSVTAIRYWITKGRKAV
ncbi:MAG: CHASE2 domain-containing protein [Cyclobacteriaceae bacterium]|nr:CHASE2 domain-containing protein [Cyclobacteriaceae bacterium]